MFIVIIFISFCLCILLYLVFYMLSFKESMDSEGVTSYECGFDLSSKTRNVFSYRFFLVSILFLIFDVEIALMLPTPYFTYEFGGFIFLLFLLILVVGLLFEYYMGILNWL